MSLKNPVTLPGIYPGTVRLVAQRLNHYATPGPYSLLVGTKTDGVDVTFKRMKLLQCEWVEDERRVDRLHEDVRSVTGGFLERKCV
jgi:uncharacterized protein (DUF1786 family)